MDKYGRNAYVGEWLDIDDVEWELNYGNLIMFDTLDGVIIEEVHSVSEDGQLWDYNKRIIPRDQIIAVRV